MGFFAPELLSFHALKALLTPMLICARIGARVAPCRSSQYLMVSHYRQKTSRRRWSCLAIRLDAVKLMNRPFITLVLKVGLSLFAVATTRRMVRFTQT